MTDREMLELAAKAAGIDVVQPLYTDDTYSVLRCIEIDDDGFKDWNPLTDDGDALRLAVTLEIQVLYSHFTGEAEAKWNRGNDRLTEYGPDDHDAATRRAIVRAAAEIGRSMSNG